MAKIGSNHCSTSETFLQTPKILQRNTNFAIIAAARERSNTGAMRANGSSSGGHTSLPSELSSSENSCRSTTDAPSWAEP